MEVRATEAFQRIVGASYLVAINQYALNSSKFELGDNDQLDQTKRAEQIARSTLISAESISIVSGSIGTSGTFKGSASKHFDILKFFKRFSFESVKCIQIVQSVVYQSKL